LIEEER